MSLDNYGVIQVPNPAPSGDGGQLLINNDKALNDARGIRKVAVPVEGSNPSPQEAIPALMSEVALARLADNNMTHRSGSGSVNLQAELAENVYHSTYNPDGSFSTIIGGYCNQAYASYTTVLGGCQNYATAQYCIAGGYQSNASGSYSIALGHSSYTNGQYAVVIGGSGSTANGTCSGVIASQSSQSNAMYSVVLGGSGVTSSYDDTYGIVYGNGGSGSTAGRSVIRGIITSSSSATVLTLGIANLGSAGASLVEADIIHGNGTTFTATQYLVKVVGTTVTVIDYRGDGGEGSASQGSFSMDGGVLTYTSENPLTAMRANVRITTMSTSSNNYYYGL